MKVRVRPCVNTSSVSTGSSSWMKARSRARQRLDLLAKDARHVGAEVLLGRVGGAARVRHVHRARQQVRPRQRDLDRLQGVAREEPQVVERERPARRDLPHAHRVRDRVGGRVEGLEDQLERRLVLDDLEHLGQGEELDAIELLGHEREEVVAAQLAVGDDVDAGLLLAAQHVDHRRVGETIELAPASSRSA